jgi:hypothetical protein
VTDGVERADQGALVADRSRLVHHVVSWFRVRVGYSEALHCGEHGRPWELVEGINQCAAVEAGT